MAFVNGGALIVGGNGIGKATCGVRSARAVVPVRMTAMERMPTSVVEDKFAFAAEPATSWKVKLLYDGECPICMKEVVFLMKKDAGRGLISFVDISADDYDPAKNAGVTWAQAMGRIHAILPDNSIVSGVKVFKEVFGAVGLGWLFAATQMPLVGNVADGAYNVWAKYRLRITGRQDLEELIREKELEVQMMEEEGECEDTCRAEYDEDEEAADLGLSR